MEATQKSSGRLLGLDVGDRRIGLAISDALGFTAQGLPTLERRNQRADMAALQEIITTYDVSGLVVGMPRNMDGSYGERAAITERFIQTLERLCHLPCIRWDERLTTRQAERVLRTVRQPRHKRKAVRDQIAAQLILQNYLDYQRAQTLRLSCQPGDSRGATH
jgi:putative Holliday junction resolvase